MKNNFSVKSFLEQNKSRLFLVFYWIFVFICLVFIKKYTLYVPTFLMSMIVYVPYRMLVTKDNDIKRNIKQGFVAVILFCGILSIYTMTLQNHLQDIIKSPELLTRKISSEKVVSMNNLNIYINEEDKKVYIYYKVNGFFGQKYSEVDNLTESDKSEYALRYGDFYKLDDNLEVAFPTYKNEFSTEYLFKVKHEAKEYIFKSFVPFENCLTLIKQAGFKHSLDITLVNNEVQSIYLNTSSKELIISDGKIAVSSKYVEVPYDKDDYFSYRYEMFKNNMVDDSKTTKNVDITLLNTYSNISSDINRITFYSEGTEETVMYGIGEIIFKDFAYVFRTGIINVDSIVSIKRA